MNVANEDSSQVSKIILPTKREVLDEYLAGSAGGVTGLLIGHPLDTVKVLLQTQQNSLEFRSVRDCISIVNSYAVNRGFFRGLSAPLISQAASNAVYFGTFFNCKYYLLPHYIQSQHVRDYVAGCFAGCTMLSIAVPVDVVKIAMQSQVGRESANRMYNSAIGCAVEILRRGGLRAAYRGLSIQAMLWVPSSGLYFWLYETCKRNAVDRYNASAYTASLLAGGVAGTVSWLSVAPLDVVKSRMQADPNGMQYRNLRECFRATWSQGGYRALFRGTSVLLVRAFPVNAVTFATYEFTINCLSKLRTQTPSPANES